MRQEREGGSSFDVDVEEVYSIKLILVDLMFHCTIYVLTEKFTAKTLYMLIAPRSYVTCNVCAFLI